MKKWLTMFVLCLTFGALFFHNDAKAAETTDGTYYPDLWTEVDWGEYDDVVNNILERNNYILVLKSADSYLFFFKNEITTAFLSSDSYGMVYKIVTNDYIRVSDGSVLEIREGILDGGNTFYFSYDNALTVVGSNFDYRCSGIESFPHSNMSYEYTAPTPTPAPVIVPDLWNEIDWGSYAGYKQNAYESNSQIIVTHQTRLGAGGNYEPCDIYRYYLLTSTTKTTSWNDGVKTHHLIANAYLVVVNNGVVTEEPKRVDSTVVSTPVLDGNYEWYYPVASTYDYRGSGLESRAHSNIEYGSINAAPEPTPNPTPTPEPVPMPSDSVDTEIAVSMNKTEVSITVPLNVACCINPNETPAFTYGDLVVINNSYVPVKLSLSAFLPADEKTYILPYEIGEILPGKSWKNLSLENSGKYFALGLRPLAKRAGGWLATETEYYYAGNVTSKSLLGILKPRSFANLELTAFHGNSFSSADTINTKLAFVAELCIDTPTTWEAAGKSMLGYDPAIITNATVKANAYNLFQTYGITDFYYGVPTYILNDATYGPALESFIGGANAVGTNVWLLVEDLENITSSDDMLWHMEGVNWFNSVSTHDLMGVIVSQDYLAHPNIQTDTQGTVNTAIEAFEAMVVYAKEHNIKIGFQTATHRFQYFGAVYECLLGFGVDKMLLNASTSDLSDFADMLTLAEKYSTELEAYIMVAPGVANRVDSFFHQTWESALETAQSSVTAFDYPLFDVCFGGFENIYSLIFQ